MNDKPLPPHIFAHNVLKQMIEHSFGNELVIDYADYQALRVAFRGAGGLWGEIAHGNVTHLALLGKIVSAWGMMPDRKRITDRVI
jgi:hypothetical protein